MNFTEALRKILRDVFPFVDTYDPDAVEGGLLKWLCDNNAVLTESGIRRVPDYETSLAVPTLDDLPDNVAICPQCGRSSEVIEL